MVLLVESTWFRCKEKLMLLLLNKTASIGLGDGDPGRGRQQLRFGEKFEDIQKLLYLFMYVVGYHNQNMQDE